MRILLCGDDQDSSVQLACELREASLNFDVSVLAAGTTTGEYRLAESEASGIAVFRAERADLYPMHWHKSASVSVCESLRAILGGTKFDLIHVLAWRGLTRDLVVTARSMGVPAIVSLNDDWATCLLEKRVQPPERETGTACTLRHSIAACLPCARKGKPETAWVPIEAEYLAFTERANAIKAELDYAAAILVESQESALRLGRLSEALVDRDVVVCNRDVPLLLATYDQAVTAYKSAGNDCIEPVWYEERMQRFAEQEWDRQCLEAEA